MVLDYKFIECVHFPPEGGVLSIVNVLGDVPPARAYFFGLLIYPRIYFLAISVDISQGKGMPFGNFGQRNVKLR